LVDATYILVLVQGAIAVVSLIEIGVMTAAGGPLIITMLVHLVYAVVMLAAARGLRRRSRRARKTVLWLEWVVIALALIDVVLALLLAHRMLELVPTLTRLVLPHAVIRLLRRPVSREEFGIVVVDVPVEVPA
jgi:ABC-type spermidine/putrescine transport system permease subunit II